MSAEGTGLARAAARGVMWVFLASVAGKLVSLASLGILARLLEPADFGLLATALVYITYAETVSDLGSGAALIYWPSRRHDAAQVTFALNLALGAFWFVLTLLLAPAVAAFFHSSEGRHVLGALAWSFPIKALGNTHDALVQKGLRFGARLVPEVGLALVKAVIAVVLAWKGFGVWSLVWGQLAGLLSWTVLLWAVVPWRPAWRWPAGLLGPMLAYGRGIVAVNVLAAVTHHADMVVVGRALGTAALGFYQMAYKLPETSIAVLIWAVSRVLFPALARVRADGQALRAAYLTSLRYTALLTLPSAVGLAVLAEPLVLAFFGVAWRPAVPLLRALALYLGLRSLSIPAGDLLKATGRPGLLATLSVVKAVVLVPALILAARQGAEAVAASLVLVTGLTLFLSLAVVSRLAKVPSRATWEALRACLASAVVLAALLVLWLRATPDRPVAVVLGLGVLLGAGGYALALHALSPETWRVALAVLRPGATPSIETAEPRRLPRRETLALGEIDRFLVPLDDASVLAYFRSDVFVPHTLRDRAARRLLPARRLFSRRLAYPPEAGSAAGEPDVLEMIARGLDGARRGWLSRTPVEGRLRWIAFRGDDFAARRRVLLFLFADGSARPWAVLKLRGSAGEEPALRREREALEGLGTRLAPELRANLPRVLGFYAEDGLEALLLTCLPGRSAYVEMQAAPGRDLARHFAAAAAWLARFQTATRRGSFAVEEEAAAARRAFAAHEGDSDPDWYRALCRACAASPLPLAGCHGDFWARNLLVDEDGSAGVVDWEHFREQGPPFEDLFQFPLTYGLNYLWSRYRRRAPEDAFRLTFLEESALAREVRRYLARWCADTGLDPGLLRPLFHLFLGTRLRRGPADPRRQERWLAFHRLLAAAGRGVFTP